LTPELRWWKEKLTLGEFGDLGWPDEASTTMMHGDYLRWCDDLKINRRVSDVDLGRRILSPWLGPRKRSGNSWKRTLLPLEEARRKFDEMAGTRTEWDTDNAPTPAALDPRKIPF